MNENMTQNTQHPTIFQVFELIYQQFSELTPENLFKLGFSPNFPIAEDRVSPGVKTPAEGRRSRSNPKQCVLKPSEVIFNSSFSPPLWAQCYYHCSEPDLIWESWDWMSCVLISNLKVWASGSLRDHLFSGQRLSSVTAEPG